MGNDIIIEASHLKAIASYQRFLDISKGNQSTPEVMRRLADLQIAASDKDWDSNEPRVGYGPVQDPNTVLYHDSIALYEKVIRDYPDYDLNDHTLYQLARAYEHRGQQDRVLFVLSRLVQDYPDSYYIPEAQFRRGELLFVAKSFQQSEKSYQAVLDQGNSTPFYEHALYKKGWSLFKQNHYSRVVDTLMLLVHRKLHDNVGSAGPATLSRADRELLDDSLRVISLSFSYLSGATSISEYFNGRTKRSYEDLIYARLGEMYLSSERFSDAAKVYAAFVSRHPTHHKAPIFQMKVIKAYEKGSFPSSVLTAKMDYVNRYKPKAIFWQHNDIAQSSEVLALLKANLTDLAHHFHALSQRSQKKAHFQDAITWYRLYLDSFPEDPKTPEMNFLLAEVLFENGRLREAAYEYERTAYHYKPHQRASEAGYAALISYDKLQRALNGAERVSVRRQLIQSSLRFADRFSQHPKGAQVLTKACEELFAFDDFKTASAVAKRVIQNYPNAVQELHRTAWIVVAHSAFDTHDFSQAESAYQKALGFLEKKNKQRSLLQQRLAASIYKQAELSRESGDLNTAISHFLRIGRVLPNATIRVTAQYDAAAALIELKHWKDAAQVLEAFRNNYPRHDLQPEVTRKLAVVYLQGGQGLKAADEFVRLGRNDADPKIRQEAIWQAADLYAKAGKVDQAILTLKDYVKHYPLPLEQAIEARQQLVQIYDTNRDARRSSYWRNEIIKADQQAIAQQTGRTRYLAANAALALAGTANEAYRRIKLTVPLNKSLKEKKRWMKKALTAYGQAADYAIETVATASTYYIADIYYDFSQALLDSERPGGLSTDELEQYDILLEEQAYPFEEKAIEIYEANAHRTSGGVYDEWIKKSMIKLAELLPVRYAKLERSEHLVETIQ
jgi:TolA-binding protein